ncbi:hypothetical protein C0J52_19310, partial [Blattella germanica]
TSHIPQSINDTHTSPPPPPAVTSSPIIQNKIGGVNGRHHLGRSLSQSTTVLPYVSRLTTSKLPKGMMEKFLATHAKNQKKGKEKETLMSGFVTSPLSSPISPMPSPTVQPKLAAAPEERNNIGDRDRGDVQRSPARRGYVSAEEKIQVELQEMQKREEELRIQRARMFARSQPNLLCIGDDEEEENHTLARETENHTQLRSALSNPNLLNSDNIPNGEGEPSLDKVINYMNI